MVKKTSLFQWQKFSPRGCSVLERIENYIVRIPESTCWYWGGALDSSGYGQVWDGKKLILAHRAMYEAAKGPITQGMQLDHICRERSCVNPSHLEEVNSRENQLRSPITNGGKTMCKWGHVGGFYFNGKRRFCSTCREIYELKRKRGEVA